MLYSTADGSRDLSRYCNWMLSHCHCRYPRGKAYVEAWEETNVLQSCGKGLFHHSFLPCLVKRWLHRVNNVTEQVQKISWRTEAVSVSKNSTAWRMMVWNLVWSIKTGLIVTDQTKWRLISSMVLNSSLSLSLYLYINKRLKAFQFFYI